MKSVHLMAKECVNLQTNAGKRFYASRKLPRKNDEIKEDHDVFRLSKDAVDAAKTKTNITYLT